MLKTRWIASTLCALFIPTTALATKPFFTGVGDLPGGSLSSVIAGVSGDGSTAVGASQTASGWAAIKWTMEGGLEALPTPENATMRFAWDASFDGSVIVGETGGPIGQSAFRYSDAEGFMNLGRFESRSTATAFRVSGDGSTVVGRSGTKAFRWTAETGMVALTDNDGNDLEAIAFAVNSDGSVVGGGVTSGPLIGPTVWDDSLGLISLDLEPGEVRGRVIDMTPDASIFVGTTDRNFGSVFTSSIGEGLTTLQQGPFLNDIVSSVSADGSVLVGADGFGPSIWEDGRILPFDLWMRDQYGVDFGRWQIIEVTGVSDDGLVFTGRGRDGPGGYAQGWYLVIPEPSSAALFSFALGLGLARRS